MKILTDSEFAALMERAAKTNLERSKDEGFASPDQGGDPLALWMRIMISGFVTALQAGNQNAIAEGLDRLIDFEHRIRSERSGGTGGRYEPWNKTKQK
jgi:hypothetical protein